MGPGVMVSGKLKCLRHGGEAKASLKWAAVAGYIPEADVIYP